MLFAALASIALSWNAPAYDTQWIRMYPGAIAAFEKGNPEYTNCKYTGAKETLVPGNVLGEVRCRYDIHKDKAAGRTVIVSMEEDGTDNGKSYTVYSTIGAFEKANPGYHNCKYTGQYEYSPIFDRQVPFVKCTYR